MRPKVLFPLFAPVTRLAGVGPKIGEAVSRIAGPNVVDLLWHLPNGIVDRRFAPPAADAPAGAVATMVLTVDSHAPPSRPGLPYRIRCRDETGVLTLSFFNARERYLRETFPEGGAKVVSGRLERYRDELQMTHPDRVGTVDELDAIRSVEPVYPLTAGLTPKPLARAVRAALREAPDLPEWQDAEWLARRNWPGWRAALRAVHAPLSADDLEPEAAARRRLAYDELLAGQLALMIVRRGQRRLSGRATEGNGVLRSRLLERLPYRLTGSQERAIAEISADMASAERMLRLLQGDVGSGKTVVALAIMLAAVEEGRQAALMAPTEVLARQHYATVEPLLRELDISAVMISGRDRGGGAKRASLLSGEAKIAFGTQAIFQESIEFDDLAVAVIDEQHRFGVHQRLAFAAKGPAPDVLVMTATPIPRTLTMTAYGDLDVSRLAEKPAGRQPVETRAVPLSRVEEVIERLKAAVADGARAFWVCPLVEETGGPAAATERCATLLPRFGGRVGLLHGRLKPAQKDETIARMAAGELDVLVATTVIEVGIDVPEATIMVVERAERFGLAQLHQLRGRVGRGDRKSVCLLLYGAPLSNVAQARLRAMREIDDGFVIAEEDLRLRGAGEILGSRQSGLPRTRLADLAAHADLVPVARDDAKLVLERDPELRSERGAALRNLLCLFERDSMVRTMLSG